jgi:hypothetical protein
MGWLSFGAVIIVSHGRRTSGLPPLTCACLTRECIRYVCIVCVFAQSALSARVCILGVFHVWIRHCFPSRTATLFATSFL